MKTIACVCTILIASFAIATPQAVALPWQTQNLDVFPAGTTQVDLGAEFTTPTDIPNPKRAKMVIIAFDEETGRKVVLRKGRLGPNGELPTVDLAKAVKKFGIDAAFSLQIRTKNFALSRLAVGPGAPTGGETPGGGNPPSFEDPRPPVDPGNDTHPGTGGGTPVPEPGTLLMLGMGLAGLAGLGMRARGRK